MAHIEEHPYRLEDAPPDLLEAFIADLQTRDEPIEFGDWLSLTAAADLAAVRQAIPLTP
jgi:hypothetical protein